MDNYPEVSIITPFLNAEAFIEESIQSVLAQTYDAWELLLIDDGSNDNSTELARKYSAMYPNRIRYYHHEGHRNRGASYSRNVGLHQANGRYIAFLDADDVYLPHKLKDQVPLLESQPHVAMLYAATEYWYSWSGQVEDAGRDWVWSNFGVPPDTAVAPPLLLTSFLGGGGTIPCMGSLLVRREALERVGGFEDSFIRQCTDQVIYAKLCLEAPVFVAGSCWDRYRQHANSSCQIASRTGEADRARLAYLEWLEGYVQSKKVSDPALWKALRGALRPYRYPIFSRIIKSAEKFESILVSTGASVARRFLPQGVWQRLRSLRR